MTALLLAHAAATLALAGLIWFVQVVHYPLFAAVSQPAFVAYELAHSSRTTAVVAPLMLVEAATAGALALADPRPLTLVGAALVAIVWCATALVSVPLHARLEHGFDAAAHRRLVSTNWIRTAAWTARAAVALALLA